MEIGFEAHGEDGVFIHPPAHDDAETELNRALDLVESGQISDDAYLRRIKKVVADYPDFIDGHAHLGAALLGRARPKFALAAYERGVACGDAVIPPDFKGRIEWGWLENRPFLRALHGMALSRLALRQRKLAIAEMERLLHLSPNDNLGVRFILGPELLRSGKLAEAQKVLEANAEEYPPYCYELGLLHWRQGNRVAAATAFRRGFVSNDYIAEILCGMIDPLPLAIWHGSNLEEPEFAEQYILQHGDLWLRNKEAVRFLRWLHTHPRILIERANVRQYREALLWERDFERRTVLVEAEAEARGVITDDLSRELVVMRKDNSGRDIWPWLYEAPSILWSSSF